MELFDPRHIVVVGASDEVSNAGGRFVRALLHAGYPGRISVVHPSAASVSGVPGYASLASCPPPVDHVVVAVAARHVPEVVRQAVTLEARSVHLFSGGFAEVDDEGARRQSELRQIILGSTTRMIGPNCMGLHRPSRGITFRDDLPVRAGPFGLVAQSGGVTIAAIRLADRLGLGMSTALSYGNAADLGAVELIGLLAQDDETDVVGVYLESANDPEVDKSLARAADDKPVILWTAGTTPTARSAARHHTGGPGGDWSTGPVVDGVLTVDSVEDLVTVAASAVTRRDWRLEPGLAFVSISGGYCVTFTTLAEQFGEALPTLPSAIQDGLATMFGSSAANVTNPIDLGGAGYLSRGRLEPLLQALGKDPAVGLVVFHLAWDYVKEVGLRVPGYEASYARALITAIRSADIPTLVLFPRLEDGSGDDALRRELWGSGIPVLEDAAQALRMTGVTRALAARGRR